MSNSSWLNRELYPFASHYLDVNGGRVHYVNEGQGPPIVMVHGTPTWSFLYRHLISHLSTTHRCIAMDHIGFGLSDKPPDWSYRPRDHAHNVRALIEHLGLDRFTLVVHDFGGPIGLAYAIDHPEHIDRLVVFNTFLWPFQDDAGQTRILKFMGGPIGKLLYLRLNFSTRFIVRQAWGTHSPLTPEVHRQYVAAASRPSDRIGMWRFAQEGLASRDWYESLWAQRDRIKDIPALVLWGLKDPAFKQPSLERWQSLLTNAKVIAYPDVGHFVPDEAGRESTTEIEAFLAKN